MPVPAAEPPVSRPTLQRWLRLAGGALAVAGRRLRRPAPARLLGADRPRPAGRAARGRRSWGLSLLYGLVDVLLGVRLARPPGAVRGHPVARRWAIKTYGLSQIGKYIPGNVFQFAARQARGMAAGVPGWALARSAAWELGLLAVCGALFGFLVLPLVAPWLPGRSSAVLFLLALAAVGAVLRRYAASPRRTP